MKEISLSITAKPQAVKYINSKSAKNPGWRKFTALLVLYSGISIGISGLLTICVNYFLSTDSSEIIRYGACMIYFAFPLMAIGIHALDRIQHSGK